jgi:hypothetical protein
VKASAMSFARFSTDDVSGKMRGYVGGGAFTDDPLETFGGIGVVPFRDLQRCCASSARTASSTTWPPTCRTWPPAVHEATSNYLGWDVIEHE